MERKESVNEIMDTTMMKLRDMVSSDAVIGTPITTPDGVTVIPVSRVSFGVASGGTDYGKSGPKFGGGGAAGAKVDPVAFLIIKDGMTRLLPVAAPAFTTVDRVVELVPQLFDRVENFIEKRKAEKDLL